MNFLLIILSGFIATGIMCFAMELITRSKIANADMIRAVGSLFTKNYNNSFIPGLVVQFSFGIFFAIIYIAILNFFVTPSLVNGFFVGFAMGFFHGIVVSLALVITVAEHHPLEKFRDSGFAVAAAHVFGHIIYGVIIGIIYGISGVNI